MISKFQEIPVPTKREIFRRVGGPAIGGQYSGDEVVRMGQTKTEIAEQVARAAEEFELPKEDLPE